MKLAIDLHIYFSFLYHADQIVSLLHFIENFVYADILLKKKSYVSSENDLFSKFVKIVSVRRLT